MYHIFRMAARTSLGIEEKDIAVMRIILNMVGILMILILVAKVRFATSSSVQSKVVGC